MALEPESGGGAQELVVAAAGGGQYRTLHEAVAAAAPGARILVRPGRYAGSVVVDRPLELLGQGPASEIVVENDAGCCLKLEAETATVRGLSLRCTVDPESDDEHPCVEVRRGHLTLQDCQVTSSSGPGVLVNGRQARAALRGCAIRNSEERGVAVEEGARATLENCDLEGNVLAQVEVFDEAEAVLRNCRLRGGRFQGVVADEGGVATLEDCEIRDHPRAGVEVYLDGRAVLRRCGIGGNDLGVWLHKGGSADVTDCNLKGNVRGSWKLEAASKAQRGGNEEDAGRGLLRNAWAAIRRAFGGGG
jgi:nitrous oxidase accessory protein NosD